jgi:hypothetical protein
LPSALVHAGVVFFLAAITVLGFIVW